MERDAFQVRRKLENGEYFVDFLCYVTHVFDGVDKKRTMRTQGSPRKCAVGSDVGSGERFVRFC